MNPLVHLHASHTAPGDIVCRVECGRPCDANTAYRALDPERVTCPECLGAVGGAL